MIGDTKTDIIKDIEVKILAGEFMVIMGKSGSGKSTLLDCWQGLIIPIVVRYGLMVKTWPLYRKMSWPKNANKIWALYSNPFTYYRP